MKRDSPFLVVQTPSGSARQRGQGDQTQSVHGERPTESRGKCAIITFPLHSQSHSGERGEFTSRDFLPFPFFASHGRKNERKKRQGRVRRLSLSRASRRRRARALKTHERTTTTRRHSPMAGDEKAPTAAADAERRAICACFPLSPHRSSFVRVRLSFSLPPLAKFPSVETRLIALPRQGLSRSSFISTSLYVYERWYKELLL